MDNTSKSYAYLNARLLGVVAAWALPLNKFAADEGLKPLAQLLGVTLEQFGQALTFGCDEAMAKAIGTNTYLMQEMVWVGRSRLKAMRDKSPEMAKLEAYLHLSGDMGWLNMPASVSPLFGATPRDYLLGKSRGAAKVAAPQRVVLLAQAMGIAMPAQKLAAAKGRQKAGTSISMDEFATGIAQKNGFTNKHLDTLTAMAVSMVLPVLQEDLRFTEDQIASLLGLSKSVYVAMANGKAGVQDNDALRQRVSQLMDMHGLSGGQTWEDTRAWYLVPNMLPPFNGSNVMDYLTKGNAETRARHWEKAMKALGVEDKRSEAEARKHAVPTKAAVRKLLTDTHLKRTWLVQRTRM